VNLQKKDNAGAVQNLQAAAPLLKSNDVSYLRGISFGWVRVLEFEETAGSEAGVYGSSVSKFSVQATGIDKLKGLPRGPRDKKESLLKGSKQGPPPRFFTSVDSKVDKVACFHTLL